MLGAFSSNLADMLTIVNPIDFGGHSSKVKVMMGIIDKCWVRGDATLCVVIFYIATIFHKCVITNKENIAPFHVFIEPPRIFLNQISKVFFGKPYRFISY